jgi:hypothetical protein
LVCVRRCSLVKAGEDFHRCGPRCRAEDCGFDHQLGRDCVYLIEKKRLPASAYDDVTRALDDPHDVLQEIPVSVEVIEAMRSVSREAVPDMPDRIVAGTAIYFGVPVISRDGMIRASSVQTIW